ncbi:unnamed protein product [Schistocephalus solidus]|uniref:Endo/exonuclease/phosphatase domain-containing protein n=1 Tax=Schistocephalus solidus TaxID=70667 RepID=A0A183SK90_SCHSO|nr:unnamed protein product [Schistocephalus solidus]
MLHLSRTCGECSCGCLYLVPNSHLGLLVAGLFPAATPRATVTTIGLNQVRVSGVVWAFTPGSEPGVVARSVSPLTLATWNVRFLLDNSRSDRPEWRTALVAREFARYNVDISAPSETRLSKQGQLEEVGAGYTLFWSGWPKAERRDAGVTFALRNDIVRRLPCLPQGINDRLMRLLLSLRGDKFATIISAYALQ